MEKYILEILLIINSEINYTKCEHCKDYYDDIKDGINYCPHCGNKLYE